MRATAAVTFVGPPACPSSDRTFVVVARSKPPLLHQSEQGSRTKPTPRSSQPPNQRRQARPGCAAPPYRTTGLISRPDELTDGRTGDDPPSPSLAQPSLASLSLGLPGGQLPG
ncbi:uncharacterized protein PSFLO_01261 [Pseudozyma flocculosa]|uniref:Uncharacterized protein n=1 Tax=Pseudozyma flocculosa TaxID=84751 RepID=A0A5C3EVB9_9BASI|nr:uncharacterized protein PSFLO_01261 [Pseudozyma flocculosa]